MKITNISVFATMPIKGLPWLFVQVDTDEGLSGIGECTDYDSNGHLARGIEALKPVVIGMDADQIENVWQTIFHRFDDLNGRGYVSHLISAIDIALWDIKGKKLGVPVYDLLGGAVRDRVPLYTHIPNQRMVDWTLEDAASASRRIADAGYEAIKTDPFPKERGPIAGFSGTAEVERLTPAMIRVGVEWMEAIRGEVGDDYELMVDMHARFDVASAIKAGQALEPFNLVWMEEPVHVESVNALRQVRENVRVPLCMGERYFTRWDYVDVIQNRLVDYVMPDVAWCGGISEIRRIASLAETQYIRLSPHDALGPINIVAGWQVCMATPNIYRLECQHLWFPTFEKMISPMFDIRDGCIFPNGQPGLGIELQMDEVEKYRVDPESRKFLNLDAASQADVPLRREVEHASK